MVMAVHIIGTVGMWEISVSSFQVCCEPKTVLRRIVFKTKRSDQCGEIRQLEEFDLHVENVTVSYKIKTVFPFSLQFHF